ncbi:tubulin polymerization-promoting protein family member 2 [Strongylocentrotus purpuratus]|uniref:Tubulin polymerization-promoting protein family member 3 n=1 Tax=Strongylocentrotus purpuratus TaxID=7668 RepID=A0A7M7RCT6_STRPU|nr:tubulin polymerization-promoting protein family member 2 [Strongylocentrotus purpuratus]|eukprot:XP_011683665.1 PREDICTED: tubulin polymerization-promoting protein family member 2 [Strongylocentrotus purpuratus]
MSDGQLQDVFKSFCAFGAGSKDAAPVMDNSKWGKMFRDLKLYDKKFTSTDTDIIFNRPEVKSKTDRKINFAQFKKALELCAEKKYGSKDDVQKLIEKICAGKGPGTSGATKASKAGGVDRLTDSSKYTGSHKERFDESGKGKGLDGRKDFDAKAAEGYVGGYKGKDTYDKK